MKAYNCIRFILFAAPLVLIKADYFLINSALEMAIKILMNLQSSVNKIINDDIMNFYCTNILRFK